MPTKSRKSRKPTTRRSTRPVKRRVPKRKATSRRVGTTSNKSIRVTRPAASGMVTRGSAGVQRVRQSGTEPLGTVQLAPLNGSGNAIYYSPGTVVYDLLINPTILSPAVSRLSAIASTYSNYRFTKLKLRVVSNLSTAMTGGVTWAFTRDVDALNLGTALTGASGYNYQSNALIYAQASESSLDLPVWQSGTVGINCDPKNDRQRLYSSTPGLELDEACQFRLLGVISSQLGVVGTFTGALSVLLFLDYDIELVGQAGVLDAGSSGGLSNIVTATGNDLITVTPSVMTSNAVYLVNPALPSYLSSANSPSSIRALFAKTSSTSAPYTDPQSAMANPDRANVALTNGIYYNPTPTNLFFLAYANYQTNPELVAAEKGVAELNSKFSQLAVALKADHDKLSDQDKEKHSYLHALLKSLPFGSVVDAVIDNVKSENPN